MPRKWRSRKDQKMMNQILPAIFDEADNEVDNANDHETQGFWDAGTSVGRFIQRKCSVCWCEWRFSLKTWFLVQTQQAWHLHPFFYKSFFSIDTGIYLHSSSPRFLWIKHAFVDKTWWTLCHMLHGAGIWIPPFTPFLWPSFVGKYTSTMVRIWDRLMTSP